MAAPEPVQPIEEALEDFGELEVAEYLVFLLALDTYTRYVEENHGSGAEDDLIKRGISLVRLADRQHLAVIQSFIDGQLPNPTHKRMLGRALSHMPTLAGLGKRTLGLRTLLSRGGTTTMRAVFKTNKALKEIKDAMAAAAVDDADAALDKFAVIPLRNQRLRKWIDVAAETAGGGTFQNPIQAAASENSGDVTTALLSEKIRALTAPPASEEATVAEAKHAETLVAVQTKATEAAQQAMKISGEPDRPATRSEVIGIATASVAAAMSNPDVQANVPSALRGPLADDPEQLRAAMTDGRVLVAAGAGSGKTTTLVGRLAYLVQDRKVPPSRIFAVTFNKKAATGIKEKIAQKIGKELADQMSIGTMHATFRRLVMDYGNPVEKAALTTNAIGKKQGAPQRNGRSRTLTNYVLNTAMAKLWKTCFEEDPPRGPSTIIQGWVMNNITPEMAMEEALDDKEKAYARWYAWFQGYKGITKGWEPECAKTDREAAAQWTGFLAEFRGGGKDRLGDFSDMIVMARDLLKRSPEARKKLQGMYDHVAVDEAQDLNEVQHEIVRYMTEHIECNDTDKSVWMVGDEIQSINRFVGARPDLFTQFHNDDCTKTRMIGTNYRCLPEIIEAANVLMTEHPRGIPMTTRPDPKKPRGEASIVLTEPEDHAVGAVGVISDIKQQLQAGANVKDYAVLSRTRLELNDYETACIIEGIPYGRKGGTSFLKSPETSTVMGYMDLVAGADFSKMQQSLAAVLDKPQRLYLPAGRAEQVVQEVINKRARRLGVSKSQVNPVDLFDREGVYDFIDAAGIQRWAEDRAVAALTELGETLKGLRTTVEKGTVTERATGNQIKYTTKSLIDEILTITGAEDKDSGNKPKLLDVLMPPSFSDPDDATDDPDEDLNEQKPVGNVAFLYQIAQGTPDTPEMDPSNPMKFKARLDDLEAKAQDLRVDLTEWAAHQEALPPAERKDAPCVTLSTIHSVKGGQWDNCTVIMAEGTFPRSPKRMKPEAEEALSAAQLEKRAKNERAEFLTERQLAYVGMTRAAKNLTIVSPKTNAYGKKTKGPSIFVQEAGIHIGQNVEGKSASPTLMEPRTAQLRQASDRGARSVLSYFNASASAQVPMDVVDDVAYDRRGP